MGLWDKLKGKANEAIGQVQPKPEAAPAAAAPPAPAPQPQAPELDVAGFSPDDEESFFNAELHMESEGAMGGTDESRAEIMESFGIRDRSHWRDVKNAMYQLLAEKHGSIEAAFQRNMNWRAGHSQRAMQQKVAQVAASGELAPVEGVSLDAWAAINASIVAGANLDDLLKGAGIDRARWDRVSAEWNARMARDTTFAIAQVYGNAFQNASKGQYAAYAREANAARAENRELRMDAPISFEKYWEIIYEQAYASKQGRDPTAALKAIGLSIVDYTDISSFMGYLFQRTGVLKAEEHKAIQKKVEAQFAAKYPGVKADVDIQF
jgi:hypothetical protein